MDDKHSEELKWTEKYDEEEKRLLEFLNLFYTFLLFELAHVFIFIHLRI
jgi:hypothetical protein